MPSLYSPAHPEKRYTSGVPFHVYLLRCADNSLYCGWCKDLREREDKHRAGKGAKYTRSRLPVKLVYSEECASLSAALKREAEIKKLNKTAKELLAGHS